MIVRHPTAATLFTAIALCGMLQASPAGASDSPADKAAAQSLFEQAKRLMNEGNYAEACPKLEESQMLDKGMGTQFHLASCYEQIGRTASAWALFVEVAAAARSAGMTEREELARSRAAALEPKLARLTIAATDEAIPGLSIQRDGVPVGQGQWGTPLPVDPGEHTITATAPGRKPWRVSVRVPDESTIITVPGLALDTTRRAVPSAAAPPEKGGLGTLQVIGLVAGGVGVAGLGAGAILGLASQSKQDESEAHCEGDLCTATGADLRESAISLGNGATAAFIAGGVLLAGGVTLLIAGPPARPEARRPLSVVPVVGPHAIGISVGGRL